MAARCAQSLIGYCASWSPCSRLEPSSIAQRYDRRRSVTVRRKLHEPLDRGWGVLLRQGVCAVRDFRVSSMPPRQWGEDVWTTGPFLWGPARAIRGCTDCDGTGWAD